MPQRQRVGSVGSLGTRSVSIIHDDLDEYSSKISALSGSTRRGHVIKTEFAVIYVRAAVQGLCPASIHWDSSGKCT